MRTPYTNTWPPPKEQAHKRVREASKNELAYSPGRALADSQAASDRRAAPRLHSLLTITDLGPESERMLHAAVRLALRHGIALHLAYHCKKPQHSYTYPIDRLTQRARHLSRPYQMRVEVRVKRELSAHELIELAPEFDLVMVHRDPLLQSDFWGTSTVARLLLDRARVRVLAYTAPAHSEPSQAARAVVAAPDEAGGTAQVAALSLLGEHERIDLLHVVNRTEFAELNDEELNKSVFQQSLREHWLDMFERFERAVSDVRPAVRPHVELALTHGNVHSEILKRLAQQPASVLVLGWHKRHRLTAWMRDRIVLRLLRDEPCPILLVPLLRPTRRS